MSNLIGASRIITNPNMRARTSAAIRQVASEKSGRTAEQGVIDPESLVPHFLARVASNVEVIANACASCGDSTAGDDAIMYIVSHTWDEVDALVHPETGE